MILMILMKILFINIFMSIINIIWVFNKRLRIMTMFRGYTFAFGISFLWSFVCRCILSVSGWWHIKLSNAFVFPKPESIFCMDDQKIWGQCGLCSFIFSCTIVEVNFFYMYYWKYCWKCKYIDHIFWHFFSPFWF